MIFSALKIYKDMGTVFTDTEGLESIAGLPDVYKEGKRALFKKASVAGLVTHLESAFDKRTNESTYIVRLDDGIDTMEAAVPIELMDETDVNIGDYVKMRVTAIWDRKEENGEVELVPDTVYKAVGIQKVGTYKFLEVNEEEDEELEPLFDEVEVGEGTDALQER